MHKHQPGNPLTLFLEWFNEAKKLQIEAEAAALATATIEGKPSVRIVLLKGCDERGFVFYTNLKSRKAQELLANPQAALCFYWSPMARQVRIEGKVTLVSKEEADAYFASRERESQISAWASKQSSPIESLESVKVIFKNYTHQFAATTVPRPDFWSGFRLIPEAIEFWILGKYRLHERIRYEKNADEWTYTGLCP